MQPTSLTQFPGEKIAQIADEIYHRGENGDRVKLVLISGPSSSGKTTFSKRLSVQLMTNGLRPYPISLDNYFVDREDTPLDENGNYDYESLYALDLELFNNQLQALLRGEEVELPRFNFTLGKKEYKGDKLRIDEHTILILEGIHALNPELTPQIPAENKYKIYVSALTTISLDDHNWIPTTDNRLLRRIIRDFNYRGYSAQETISRWPSVRAGEDKWIFPYQENADVMYNSALLFEFAVLRCHAEPILTSVPRNCPEYAEAYRLMKFIKYFTPVQDKEIPTSLLREFLGGSSFQILTRHPNNLFVRNRQQLRVGQKFTYHANILLILTGNYKHPHTTDKENFNFVGKQNKSGYNEKKHSHTSCGSLCLCTQTFAQNRADELMKQAQENLAKKEYIKARYLFLQAYNAFATQENYAQAVNTMRCKCQCPLSPGKLL